MNVKESRLVLRIDFLEDIEQLIKDIGEDFNYSNGLPFSYGDISNTHTNKSLKKVFIDLQKEGIQIEISDWFKYDERPVPGHDFNETIEGEIDAIIGVIKTASRDEVLKKIQNTLNEKTVQIFELDSNNNIIFRKNIIIEDNHNNNYYKKLYILVSKFPEGFKDKPLKSIYPKEKFEELKKSLDSNSHGLWRQIKQKSGNCNKNKLGTKIIKLSNKNNKQTITFSNVEK